MRISHHATSRALLLAGCSILAIGISAGGARADSGGIIPASQLFLDDLYSVFATKPFSIQHGSLIISSSTYDPTQGPLKNLTAGVTTLPNTDTATTKAVSGNNYVTVWNNDTVDGSFGLSSAIRLTVINPSNDLVAASVLVPPTQVVTSFSSKSELAIQVTMDSSGVNHLLFTAYGAGYGGVSPGVGALDVSQSDAVSGQDPTNPVTYAFGTNYFFHRTIVAIDQYGNFTYTPTINYGGDNSRAALLGSNGLYYTAGNSNNGNASVFTPDPGSKNDTNPNVTETTGLEVVKPINGTVASVTIPTCSSPYNGNPPTCNSAEVDPMLDYTFSGTADKAGKDDNFRSVTQYGNAIYVAKGSGSNGFDTVYSVSSLPTVANAGSLTLNILPGFPGYQTAAPGYNASQRAKTGPDYTPFGLFFANATTLYVADEGSGDATDVASHAGLEKWSLVSGVWHLDYVLQKGLIGAAPVNLTGSSGPYPTVTNTGLRNLTGVVNNNGTVTLWATTATTSSSGDAGADPNQVVEITDELAATTLTGPVTNETFTTIAGPVYGTVFRGVAYAQ